MNPAEWTILRDHAIRWSECDPYAHANHTAYLTLFEDLRVDHWRALAGGLIGQGAIGPVLAQVEVRYLKPVVFGDAVVLGLRTAALRRSSYTQDYALWKAGEVCCTARAVLVATSTATGAKVPLPDAIRARLIAEGAVQE